MFFTKAADFFLKVDYNGSQPGDKLQELEGKSDADGTPWVEVSLVCPVRLG